MILAMKASQLVCLLLIFMTLMTLTVSNLLTRAQQSNQFCDSLELMVGEKENSWRQDVLGAFTNPLNERYAYLSTLLKQYKNSSASIRPFSLSKDIHGMVTKLAYLDSRINLIGWILFGPKEARPVLHSVRDIKSHIVNDPCCLKSTLELFERHCGALIEQRMKQSLANLCNYVVEKEAIREAIMLACGMESTESHELMFPSPLANDTRWEVLEVTAKHIHIDDGIVIKVKEGYSYLFWDLYKTLPRSQRLGIIHEMSEILKRIAYWESKLDMIRLILSEPERSRAILRASADRLHERGDMSDYSGCVETTDFLLGELCGPMSFYSTRHTSSITHMCKFVEKQAIQDAIIMTCGLNNYMESVDDDDVDDVVAQLIKMAPFDDADDGISQLISRWVIIAIACSLALYYMINFIR